MQNLFEFIEQDMLIRIESIFIELENVQERFNGSIDRIASDIQEEVKFIREKQMHLNVLKYQTRPKMNNQLKEFRVIAYSLHNSSDVVQSLVNKLRNFKTSIKQLPRDKSLWFGKLLSTLKPLVVNEILNSSVRLVDMFGYTTNLTSLCPLDNGEGILVLDNYLNSVNLFDKNLNLVKSVCLNDLANVRQSHLAFNANLYGIAASSKYVYINNMDQNQIVVLNHALNNIKAIFTPLKTRSMFEIDTYADTLFVLDNRNRELYRYLLFTKNNFSSNFTIKSI